jgi:uncharacterized iron-regulated membrane protein
MAVRETSRVANQTAAERREPQRNIASPRPPQQKASWLRRPRKTFLRRAMFQIHLWSGLILGLYIVVVCVSGSALVFRHDLYDKFESYDQARHSIRIAYKVLSWFGDLHGSLLLGHKGMAINAVGGFLTAAVCVTGLIIWWPGIARWRRALTVRGGVGWKRFNFDLHSALGFWTFLILFVWGMTGGYFVFPEPFRAVINYFTPIDPPRVAARPVAPLRAGEIRPTQASPSPSAASGAQRAATPPGPRRRRPLTKGGKILQWFSFLHYGNFGGWGWKALWTLLGFAPAILFGTAVVMWWNRVLSPALRRSRRKDREWAEVPAAVAPELEWEQE